jgi:hypothetical protein
MGSLPAFSRFWLALLLALLLGLRLLAPAGFMPAFDRGTVTIVACPDASVPVVPRHHHHPASHKNIHQPCPYAAASALGAVTGEWAPLIALLAFAAVLLLGNPHVFIERRRTNERPHPRGPPFPA